MIKNFFLTIFFVTFVVNNALATSIFDALKQAYKNNTELNAERENIKVSKEELKISKSEYFPSATITSSKSKENTEKLTNQGGGDASITDVDPLTTSIKLEQTIIDFGRGAEYNKKKIGINLAEAKLIKKEQEILYKVIEIYTGLIFSNEKLKINQQEILCQFSLENNYIKSLLKY